MSPPDLKVDTDALRKAGTNLKSVATAFSKTEAYADDYADNCGDRGLSSALHDFADSWDEHRSDLGESIDGLGELAKKAGETYEKVEQEFVKALRGEKK